MRRWIVLACVMMALAGVARADDFGLPGLDADATTYADALARRFPAGGTPKGRATAEQLAAAALARHDFPAAAAALEQRLGMGEQQASQWRDLAAALMRRTPPDAAHASAAAWRAYSMAQSPQDEIAALLLVADSLRSRGQDAQAVQALEQVKQSAPDDAGYARLLADAQRAAGMLVQKVDVEGEADPPRACIRFTAPPSRRADFFPHDWVRLDPPVPGAAVTREGDALCVSGLPSGATTTAVLRAGLPAEARDGGAALTLAREAKVALVVPDRAPGVAFDTRLFVLPRGQAPAVTLTTTNLSSVALSLLRLSERGAVPFLRENRLGDPVEEYAARNIGEQSGREVWKGHVDIQGWKPNARAKTALPMPPPLLSAGPGLYALLATPGDGTQSYAASVQMIVRTDLAPTVWRGADGLTVQVRGYSDAKPRPGTKLRLLAHDNDVLGEATTDADGFARFAAPLLHGEGSLAPAAIDAVGADDDYCLLDLNAAAFDLSDRGVSGSAPPGPLDAFVWFDRGIFRPGETVQVMALLRDDSGKPVDLPARVTIRRPNGQVFSRTTPARDGGASIHLPVALSAGAAAGTWTVEVQADPDGPVIGAGEFRVDAFVPDRMAVDLGPPPVALVAGKEAALQVTARFLYGAPGAGLTGKGRLVLTPDPAPFPALAGYRVGLVDEQYVPAKSEADLPATDAQGHTSYAITLAQVPDTTQALHAEVTVDIDDPSGHASRAKTTIPVRPGGPVIGIKPNFDGGSVDEGAEAGFDIAAVSPDGARQALPAHLRLVRERPDWHYVLEGRLARYEVVYRDEPLETRDVTIPADGAGLRVAKTLPFGRYRLEATQAGGLAATSVRFSAGWGDAASADVPDRVDVGAARQTARAGETVRVHVAPPFAGQATLLVLSDRVLATRTLDVPADGADVDLPVEASWGPGAYVAVHVFRAGDATRPGRAIGLTWIGIDPAARTLPLTLDVPDRLPPRARTVVPVHAAPGAWVTLAAVDEGILRLTDFASPDPLAHYFGRRRLGIDIRDDWGRLIAPAEGEAGVLRQGGDSGSFALPDVPQHTVVLFAGPVRAGADGIASLPLDIPDFNGQVRLMAVAWESDRVASASRDVIVRDPLVAEALLPRFLAPGDHARLSVLLHDLDLPGGAVRVKLATDGPLAIDGPSDLTQTLAPDQRVLVSTNLYTTGAGRGVLHLDVTGPAGFHVAHDSAITIRPARGATTTVAGVSLLPGAEQALAPPVPLDRYVAGTVTATAEFGAPVRYDAGAVLRELADYPFSCLEQSTSRGLPLTVRRDTTPGVLQPLVSSVLDRQRYDGAFGLWSAGGDAQPWLSSYATEFLIRARDAGATVPEAALDQAVKYLADAVGNDPDSPEAFAAQAYRLYVLARAGQGRPGAARVLSTTLNDLPTPLAKAQLGAALALAHDTPRAEAAFVAALDADVREWWWRDYGSTLRDRAAMVVLLRESGLLPERLARLIASLPGPDLDPRSLSTQEQAWLVTAAGVLGRAGASPRVAVDGIEAPVVGGVATVSLVGPVRVRNMSGAPTWQSVSVRGVPLVAPPAQRAGMKVTRHFQSLDGGTLDLDHLAQNTEFVLLLEGRAEDGQEHHAMLQQGLPAGWEIVGRLAAGSQAGMPWLGVLSETEAEPAADDRFAAVLDLAEDKSDFRVAVRLRAVTPGDYEIPGADLSDMYRPGIFARQAANRIKVLGGE